MGSSVHTVSWSRLQTIFGPCQEYSDSTYVGHSLLQLELEGFREDVRIPTITTTQCVHVDRDPTQSPYR